MAQNPPQDPCDTRSRLVEHESYCDKYYQCIDNQILEFDCPNGLVYAGKGRGLLSPCDYDYNVDCTDRPNRSTYYNSQKHVPSQ